MRKDAGRLDTIPGFLPSLGATIQGCVFADRCALADDRCRTEQPRDHRGRRPVTWPAASTRIGPASFPRQEVAEILPCRPSTATAAPLVRLDDLGKVFQQQGHDIHALVGVSAEIWKGETLGLVGESGSGKTTLARTLLGIVGPSSGTVELEGRTLAPKFQKRNREDLRALQIVFQNPDSALNRRHAVRRILMRAMSKLAGVRGAEAERRVAELVDRVRLSERTLTQKPVQLSGGLKQRVAIARAFAGDPKLVVCDEPTSALDVSVQAAILNLLVELQAERGVSYLFISHDLGVVRYISDRIAVLYLGRLMELAAADVVFGGPHHPVHRGAALRRPHDRRRRTRSHQARRRHPERGEPAERLRLPHPLSPEARRRCARRPSRRSSRSRTQHLMRCHIPLEELRALQQKAAELG